MRRAGRPQAGGPALAAEAALLVAAERRGRVEVVVGVLPDHAGLQRARDLERLRALVGPDARGQPVRGVVRLLDRLGLRAEGEHRDDRPEDLLDRDPVRGRDVGEERRREPAAAVGQLAGDRAAHRALLLAGGDQRLDPVELLARVDGAHVGVLVERVADAQARPCAPRASPIDRRRPRSPGSSSREPAQHTWPWLKKIPLTIPSTAWSIAASSKTMLADLPPSSSVSGDRRARRAPPGCPCRRRSSR